MYSFLKNLAECRQNRDRSVVWCICPVPWLKQGCNFRTFPQFRKFSSFSVCKFYIWWSISSISDEAFQHFWCWTFHVPKLGPGALGNRLLPVKWQDSLNVYFKNKCVIKNKNKIALVCHVQQARWTCKNGCDMGDRNCSLPPVLPLTALFPYVHVTHTKKINTKIW